MDARDPHDEPLPTDVPTLHGMVRSLQAELTTTRAELTTTRAELTTTRAELAAARTELEAAHAELAEVRAKLDKLLAVTFGRRSERAKRTPPPPTGKPPPRRHDHGRAPLPDHLERQTITHDLTDEQKACPGCGQTRVRIGEQATEQLDCEPIRFFVRRTVRVCYACRRCDPADTAADERVITAGPATVGPIPKGLPGPGLLAYTLTAKFADHIPLHRLAGIIARSGVSVAQSTLGDWVRQAAGLLTPLCQLMHRRVLAAHALWSDDTRVRYQVPGRDKTAAGRLWVTIGDTSAPYTTFHFTANYTRRG